MTLTSRERPILFSGEMVRAILDGRKTQTRRVMKLQPDDDGVVDVGQIGSSRGVAYVGNKTDGGHRTRVPCPYGVPGDRLWVRENGWERPPRSPSMIAEGADTWVSYYYDADGLSEQDAEDFKAWGFKRRPSIHMPRWASRITLEITGVRVERLQDIRYKDCFAEGIYPTGPEHSDDIPRREYHELWDKIHGPGAWDKNPWVWVVEFKTT